MKLNQRRLHEEQDVLGHDAPPVGEMIKDRNIFHRFGAKIKKFLAFNKGFLTLGALFALWGTVGEIVLDHPYRFSTFIGKRSGNVASEEIKTAIPAEAAKQEVVMAAGGAVELKKNCQALRNQLGQNAYAQCIARNETMPVCEFRKQQAEMQPCDEFSAETLVDDYQRKTNQGATP